jgi:hypothetical protein
MHITLPIGAHKRLFWLATSYSLADIANRGIETSSGSDKKTLLPYPNGRRHENVAE